MRRNGWLIWIDLPEFVAEISIWAVPILLAIIIHEVMHGVVARDARR